MEVKASVFLPLPQCKPPKKQLLLSITARRLTTGGGAFSPREMAERAVECTRQIIFIWDPGGY